MTGPRWVVVRVDGSGCVSVVGTNKGRTMGQLTAQRLARLYPDGEAVRIEPETVGYTAALAKVAKAEARAELARLASGVAKAEMEAAAKRAAEVQP